MARQGSTIRKIPRTASDWIKLIGAALGVVVVSTGIVASLMGLKYYTRAEAVTLEDKFQEHEKEYEVHVERARAQSDILREMRVEQKEQSKLQGQMARDQATLLERFKLRSTARPRNTPISSEP